jgi:hypothetical protein
MPKVRREKRVQVPLEFADGLVVNVTIDKNRTTSAWLNSLEEGAGDKEACDWMAAVIIGWDVEDENGPLPITGEAIYENFDQEDLQVFLRDIRAALVPSRAEKNESSQPSSEKPSTLDSEVPSTSPNGSETSELQPVSASPSTK